jgi:hypothetical protein
MLVIAVIRSAARNQTTSLTALFVFSLIIGVGCRFFLVENKNFFRRAPDSSEKSGNLRVQK